MAGQTIQISVLADTKKFSSAMKKLSDESGLTRLGSTLKSVGKAAAIGLGAAGAAAGALAAKGVELASNLEQSMGGVDAIFKGSADQVHTFAKSAAGNLGLAQNSYNELAAIIGTTLKNSGTPMDALAGKTDDLITVSADLAATFGGPVTDASNAMASALRGEFEPLRKYGVSLNQADINAKAMAMSGAKSAKELTKQQKAVATQALILEQSADAQGAFARESNTLAGQQERLKAKFENINTTIGTYLLPVLTKVTTWLSDNLEPAFKSVTEWIQNNVVPALQSVGTWYQDNETKISALVTQLRDHLATALTTAGTVLGTVVEALKNAGTWIKNNADWILPLAAGIGAMVAAYQTYVKVMAIWQAATKVAAAVQLAFNAVLSANPIGIVVLAVVGLVTAIVLLWKKNEGFRNAIKKIWEGIKKAFSTSIDAVTGFLSGLWDFIKKVWGYSPIGMITGNWDAIKGAFNRGVASVTDFLQNVWDFIKKVWSFTPIGMITTNWDAIVAYFKAVPGKITEFFGNATDILKGAGGKIIDGLLDGIKNGFNKVKETLGNLTDLLPDWKGPAKRDAKILKPAGRLLMKGLVAGITEGRESVKKSLQSLTDSIGKMQEASVKRETDRLLAARRKQNAKIREFNKTAKKGQKKDLLPTLSRADAEKQAKKNVAATKAATKAAQKTLAAQGKTTKSIWADGGAKGLSTLLAGFTDAGKRRGGKAGKAVKDATLTDLAKGREIIATRLENANARLEEMQGQYDQMKSSISSSIRGEHDLRASITAATEDTEEIIERTNAAGDRWFEKRTVKGSPAKATFASVAAGVKTMAAKARTFAGKLQALVGKGIPPGLVQEVAALGTTEGITVADALLSGTAAEVKELSADYSALGKWSDAAGAHVADQMYGAGIAAQEGFIKGLEADDAKLLAAAKTLTAKVTAEVKKELGIKSPSRVFKSLGRFTVDGFTGGMEDRYRVAQKSLDGFANDLAQTPFKSPTGTVQTPAPAAAQPVVAVVDPESMRRALHGAQFVMLVDGRPVKAIVQAEITTAANAMARGY